MVHPHHFFFFFFGKLSTINIGKYFLRFIDNISMEITYWKKNLTGKQ